MTVRCPDGHDSATPDHCATCGLPIDDAGSDRPAGASGAAGRPAGRAAGAVRPGVGAGTAARSQGATPTCPHCGEPVHPGANYCEVCGRDPNDAPAVPSPSADPPATQDDGRTLILTIRPDGDWHREMVDEDEPPLTDEDYTVILTVTETPTSLGRGSSRRAAAETDLTLTGSAADPAVSHRQCLFERDAGTWTVRDTDSANGTWVTEPGARTPAEARPLRDGEARPLTHGDTIFIGAWTRISVKVIP